MKYTLTLSVLLIVALGCTSKAEPSIPMQNDDSPSRTPGLPPSSAGGQPIFISEEFRQGVKYLRGLKVLSVKEIEKDENNNYVVDETSHAVSYKIQLVEGRVADEFYVVGVGRGQADIIEQWKLPAVAGSYFAARSTCSSPIGVACPNSVVTTGISNPPYIPPIGRPVPTPIRTEIYRGTELEGIRAIAADPEGRFLLVISDVLNALFRFEIEENAEPSLLYTSATIPHLDAVTMISPWQHATQGRKYVLRNQSSTYDGLITILHDPNNDGNFESWDTMTDQQYAAALYQQNLIDDFIFHQ